MTNVALAHDYLTQRGGAERVVLEMARAFPDSPLFTSLFEPAETFPEFMDVDVRPSFLNRSATLRTHHRRTAPLLAPVFSRMQVDADVVLCSSSGWSHGLSTDGRKVVYCHNPARWLYQYDQYHQEMDWKVRMASRLTAPALRWWDRAAAQTADRYIANSRVVQTRIRDTYGIDAPVVHPPTSLDPSGFVKSIDGVEPGFLLTVARLLPYKKIDVVIEALDELSPETHLVVVGRGPDLPRLEEMARGRNVTLLGPVDAEELRWLYRSCSMLVTASFEDFGLTPIEAALFGRPTVALRWGGFLETTVEGLNGTFFDQPIPALVAKAISAAQCHRWDEAAICEHAALFSPERFRKRITEIVHEG